MKLPTALAAFLAASLAGCTGEPTPPKAAPAQTRAGMPDDAGAEVAAERAKLSPDDRALVEAQEWCVVSDGERLGSMGPPIKLTVKGQSVFVCCKGCQRKALSDPDKTIAKLEELKARAAKARG